MEISSSRRARPAELVFASAVLLINGVPMLFAAVVSIAFVRTLTAAGTGLALAGLGAALITAVIRLYTGSRVWWVASFGLLPVSGAAHFLDAFMFGDGRVPAAWGIVMPTAALVCLLLRPVRTLFTPQAS
ncbi:hypothetical protein HC028_02755 [Planosporangium flavigriseum]|nr:hypothetical protein [Planosporangium flavigriseum]NJC63435.1 hypothetical protein [Planosporangium flavigriseum]